MEVTHVRAVLKGAKCMLCKSGRKKRGVDAGRILSCRWVSQGQLALAPLRSHTYRPAGGRGSWDSPRSAGTLRDLAGLKPGSVGADLHLTSADPNSELGKRHNGEYPRGRSLSR